MALAVDGTSVCNWRHDRQLVISPQIDDHPSILPTRQGGPPALHDLTCLCPNRSSEERFDQLRGAWFRHWLGAPSGLAAASRQPCVRRYKVVCVTTQDPDPTTSGVGRYPDELSCEVMTKSGLMVHLRPIRSNDGDGLSELHGTLSARSVYRRFFFVHPVLSPAEIDRFTHIDYVNRLALVVEEGTRLIGVGRYERLPGTSEAEVAFVVADADQHLGLGTALLEHLTIAAWKSGITAFVAQTLAENHDMLGVFMHSGFPVTSTTEYGTVSVRFPIGPNQAGPSAWFALNRPSDGTAGTRGARIDSPSIPGELKRGADGGNSEHRKQGLHGIRSNSSSPVGSTPLRSTGVRQDSDRDP
jgi:GNAT superfamily N-acetyltransferase